MKLIDNKLIDNWKEVLGGAWTVWLMVAALLVSAVDAWLRMSAAAPAWLPDGALPILTAVLSTLAIPARIIVQTNMSQWLARWWADESGAVRKRTVAGGVIVAAALAAVPTVRTFEGQVLQPYYDVVGKLTWCSGETEGIPKESYTPQECDDMLAARLVEFSQAIDKCLPDDTPFQARVAFVSASYNIGVAGFCGSSMSRRALAGNMRGACDALLMWDKGRVNGVLRVIRGLTIRRKKERELCLTGVPA